MEGSKPQRYKGATPLELEYPGNNCGGAYLDLLEKRLGLQAAHMQVPRCNTRTHGALDLDFLELLKLSLYTLDTVL